ncbi:MAG: hypothetical protein ABIH21_04185 [Patescibacteria group bacterium]
MQSDDKLNNNMGQFDFDAKSRQEKLEQQIPKEKAKNSDIKNRLSFLMSLKKQITNFISNRDAQTKIREAKRKIRGL